MAEYELTEQDLYRMGQQLEASIGAAEQSLAQVNGFLRATSQSIEALQELQKNKDTVMIDVGTGVFVEAEIKNSKKCKKMIGENIFTEDSAEEVIKQLEARKAGFEKQAQKIQQRIAEDATKLNDVAGLIRQIEAEKRKYISRK